MDEIAKEEHRYRPRDQNSNTTVDEALRRAGLPEPKNDDLGDNWAPGSGNNLPGGSDDAKSDGSTGDNLFTGISWTGTPIDDLQDAFDTAQTTSSPLILDLDGDGVETIGTSAGIHFDHDGNKFAETTGWVGKDDGLLVWDKNGNNAIPTTDRSYLATTLP